MDWKTTHQLVQPGPSSQTTSVVIEGFINDSFALHSFDIPSAVIEPQSRQAWRGAANDVLEENRELWERIADL